MTTSRCTATLVAAAAWALGTACKVPLLPKWNADEQAPLASQKITLVPPFPAGVAVPGGTSQTVSFPAQSQSVSGLVSQLLKNGLVAGSVSWLITKSATVNGTDTLFVAANQSDLTNPASQRIVVPVSVTGTAATRDSNATAIPAAGLSMLQTVANGGGTLWVQMRGQATCPAPGPCTFQATDSIGVKLVLLATVPISR